MLLHTTSNISGNKTFQSIMIYNINPHIVEVTVMAGNLDSLISYNKIFQRSEGKKVYVLTFGKYKEVFTK